MTTQSANYPNMLWKTRQELGLERKQVARLLGHRSTNLIMRYENGKSLPNLKTVIKLCLIYRAQIEELFPELTQTYRAETENKLALASIVFISLQTRQSLFENIHYCSYANLLDNTNAETKAERSILIRRHLTRLAKRLANF